MTAKRSAEELREEIVGRFPELSNRLQKVARFVIDHETDFALETLAEISSYTGIQPSAIVRFAKEFGYDGASAMQRLFRERLIREQFPNNYEERAKRAKRAREYAGSGNGSSPRKSLLGELVDANMSSLQQMEGTIIPDAIDSVIAQIAKAKVVYIVGFRRSFPVAAYLSYALGKAGKRVILIDGIAGIYGEQLAASSDKDALIAVSFHSYAEETMKVCSLAAKSNVNIIAISDSKLSPISKLAKHTLIVHDADIDGFRSLSTSLCLAQAITVGYLFSMDRKA